jgi:para-nitrobenzyl esterase
VTDAIALTTAGAVRGARQGGVSRFLGVPYAAPPVGERRFAAPAPPEPWRGERDATRFGPNAPQALRPFDALDIAPLVGSGWVPGDHFLNVNIWTPDPEAQGLPVMVFIHGGAFVAGSNRAAAQDGTAFARSGVVCMAISYRLGVEGFLPIPGAPTNLGLRDQLVALAWVRDNAAAFGGDPANVTVFGESAGGMSVANLLASPLAKGLFRRAIVQSGHGSMVRPISVAQRVTRRIARVLNTTPDLAGFRARTMEACLTAVDKVQAPTARIDLRDDKGREPAFGLSRFLPVYGDDVLPVHPLQALAEGVGSDVTLLIGANAEEMNLYFAPTGALDRIPGWMAWYVLARSVPNARALLRAYGLGKGKRPGEALTLALHDLVFRHPARVFAAAHRGLTHLYEFDWRSPALGGRLGACHALEIPFVFDTLASCKGPKGIAGDNPPQGLADRLHRIWRQFATSGDLPWPCYEDETRQVYRLACAHAVRDLEMPAAHFWP